MFLLKTHPVVRGIKIGSNQPPQWQNVPSPNFILGIAANFPPSGTYQSNNYVTDADGETITLTWVSGSITGVTWDGGKFVYSGGGSAGTTGSLVLRANDGTDIVDSSAFSIVIESNLSWSSTPFLVFVEASVTPQNLGAYVTNFSASTDEFRVTPGYSLPPWLSLTPGPGTGSGNLTPNGNQVDANDVPSSPGIKIDVRRSGGSWVSSNAFGITVNPVISATGSINDLAYEGPAFGAASATGKHANIQYCPLDSRFYVHGGDGSMAIPGGTLDSGAIHSLRWTFNANATNISEDLYYPYWGYAGEFYPSGAGCNSWCWDSSRNCFWSAGGVFEGLGWTLGDARNVGVQPTSNTDANRIWRFDLTGALAFRWQALTAAGFNFHGEGHGAVYVPPPIDCLFAFRDQTTSRRFHWYNCATGATGQMTIGLSPVDSPYSGPFPGNVLGDANDQIQEDPMIYDSVTNEIIWQCHDSNYKGIYATSLANFPGNLTTRQLWRGFENGGTASGYAQKPFFIRNRKLYSFGVPHKASTHDGVTVAGNGLGIYELDLTTLEMSQGSQPTFELKDETNVISPGAPFPIGYMNEGAYSPAVDALLATHRYGGSEPARVGSEPLIFKWSPPSWTPPAGFVKAITTDSIGNASNTFRSVAYSNNVGFSGSGATTASDSVIGAWGSACYARNLSTNGCMLFHGGGDADYWGNEVYAFDFDTRRFRRIVERAVIGGVPSSGYGSPVDSSRSTSDPLYYNSTEAEHGPLVADTGSTKTLLPAGTTPAVAHNYDQVLYLPATAMGNRRGAMVLPVKSVVYLQGSSTRAHYLDLDQVVYRQSQVWGRMSNRITISGGRTMGCVYDEVSNRIYHPYGYIDVSTYTHTTRNWGTEGFNWQGEWPTVLDTERRLWIMPAGGTMLRAIDIAGSYGAAETNYQLTLSGNTSWLAHGRFGGMVYVPDVDAIFFYNNTGFGSTVWNPQQIVKIQPPAGNPITGTWNCTLISMPNTSQGGVDIVGDANVHGTYGRIQWIPPLKCLAFLNSATGSMYLYKPIGV